MVERYALPVLSAHIALSADQVMKPTRKPVSHGWDASRLRLVLPCVATAATQARTSIAPAPFVRLTSLLLEITSSGARSTKPHTPRARSHAATSRKRSAHAIPTPPGGSPPATRPVSVVSA